MEKINTSMIVKILLKSKKRLGFYLNIKQNSFDYIIENFVVRTHLSGHNNKICLIDFYNNHNKLIGNVCLKYCFGKEKIGRLKSEFNILKILKSSDILVPEVLSFNRFLDIDFACIIMSIIDGKIFSDFNINISDAGRILSSIERIEKVLNKNINKIQNKKIILNLNKKIDFEKKLLIYIKNNIPNFTIISSLSFINKYLNSKSIMNKRVLVTDRSVVNIFKRNSEFIFIDFSTIRIGTEFDNWIQFIDDPRAKLTCDKTKLIKIFFAKKNLKKNDIKYFYTASVYTNLLQGIFSYQNDHKLGISYFENANKSFMKLMNKKSVLIDVSHQHTSR